MTDTSLRARLSRLFATNVVVRRISKNRLKAVDTNRLQSTGNMSNKRYVDRFSGVHKGMPGYGTYNQNQTFHTSKIIYRLRSNGYGSYIIIRIRYLCR